MGQENNMNFFELPWSGFTLSPDAGDGGGGAAGAGQQAGGQQAPPDVIPRAEAQAAFKARDQAKAEARLLATELGIDPSGIKLVPTGDAQNPFKLEVEGLSDIKAAIENARTQKLNQQRATGKWDEREKELTAAHQRQLQAQAAAAGKTVAAYQAWLEGQAVEGELRATLIAEGAIDTAGDGTYADLIALTRNRLKVEQEVDQETGKLTVKIKALDANGQPMLDPQTGQPLGVKAAVTDFLAKRPALKKAGVRPGPGAGGYGMRSSGGGDQQPPQNAAERGQHAADRLFGKPR